MKHTKHTIKWMTASLIAGALVSLPRLALAGGTTLVADAYTKSTLPITNYGAATSLLVQGPPANAIVDITYLQFDLSTLPTGTVGNDIAKATVILGVNKVTIAGSFDVFRVTSAWTEAGINPTTAPTLAGSAEVSAVPLALADKNDFKTIDITQLVKDWLDGVLPNNGIAIKPNGAGVSAQFDSKETTLTSHVPQLDVEFSAVTNFKGTLSGDVTGTQTATHVAKINGAAIGSLGGATNGQLLTFNGSTWAPSSVVNALAASSGVVPVANGGTGSGTASGARGNLGAAASGANSDIVSLKGASDSNANTAVGLTALSSNTTGTANTAAGFNALSFNTTGNFNTAVGREALSQNTTAISNTAMGFSALTANTTGFQNVAVGTDALQANTVGFDNVAVGMTAMQQNTSGTENVALGRDALLNNTTGTHNIALGSQGLNGGNLTTGSYNIDIGNPGAAGESNTIRIGNNGTQSATYMAGLYNAAVGGDGKVAFVDSTGKLGTGNVVTSLTAGSGVSVSSSTGNVTVSVPAAGVSNGMLANSSVTVNAGTGLSGGGAVALGGSTTLNNAGVLSVGASAPLASSGGQNPSVSLSGTVPVANGGTGSSTTSGARGNLGAAASGDNLDIVSLKAASDASYNTAAGRGALGSNTTGYYNTAAGKNALNSNTTGSDNTAAGVIALSSNTTGHANTAVGGEALYFNTTGSENTAAGAGALGSNTTGYNNTAQGANALSTNTTGNGNIAVGFLAGNELTTGSNNIDIGNQGVAGESNAIRIGDPNFQTATFIAGINGAISSGGVAVLVNSDGQLGTITSSARFKENIHDMGDSTSALMKLRPVSFRYKKDIDPSGLEQYGLVAEEVAKVYPDLVVYDDKGKPQTVRYHFINAMLLNEVQKQARLIEALTARLTQVEAAVSAQGQTPAVEVSHKTPPGL